MGSCDNNKICLANLENNDSKFICDDHINEEKLYNYQAITFINDENNSNDNKFLDNKNDNTLNDNLTKITDMIKNNQDIIYNNYVIIIIIIIITFIVYYMYK